MKKGMFMPVLFILGFVASATAQSSLLYNVDGVFNNAPDWLSTNATAAGFQDINSTIYSAPNNTLARVVFPVYNSNITLNAIAKTQAYILGTSRINTICSYRPKSLIKD